jgi:7 transmembrane sweet-taste receptor of 3 GCPR
LSVTQQTLAINVIYCVVLATFIQCKAVYTRVFDALQLTLTVTSEYVAPSVPQLKMPSSFDRYIELYCHKSTAWFLIPLVYNIVLMLVCAVIGFITRKLPENFNESWFIFVSVSTTLFAWVVFIPAYFSSYYAYMQPVILGFCLILICFVTLGCQFVPIIYAVIFLPADRIKVLAFNENSANHVKASSIKPVVEQRAGCVNN